jgi:hypothetical protein
MKTRQLLLTILFLFTVTCNYAQVSFTQSGIAVQGIVRDNNNTAITDGKPISMTFTINYGDKEAFSKTEPITPDSFGVFSYVMDVAADKMALFSRFNMRLIITAQIGDLPVFTVSDEPLKAVPYAISANNGVPMGSVMPYLGGGNAPIGWIFCKGQQWSEVGAEGADLKAFLNNPSTVPNLQGMFLRGAGENTNPNENGMTFTGNDGPLLNAKQDDGFESHLHDEGELVTENDGVHTHNYEDGNRTRGSGAQTSAGTDYEYHKVPRITDPAGEHNHAILGNTGSTGIPNETRPVNYGVNYIIKL